MKSSPLPPSAEGRAQLPLRAAVSVAMAALMAACATSPTADPRAVRRLDPTELQRIDAVRPGRPLSLDDIVRRSREGEPTAVLLDALRTTGTHHALNPSDVLRLRDQGVAPEVLDALAEAQARHDRDQAAADKARQMADQAAALTGPGPRPIAEGPGTTTRSTPTAPCAMAPPLAPPISLRAIAGGAEAFTGESVSVADPAVFPTGVRTGSAAAPGPGGGRPRC